MSGGTLRICPACHEYTLADTCPSCGKPTNSPRPPRYSPEDKYGKYRRQLHALDAAEKAAAGTTPKAAQPKSKGGKT